MQSSEIRAKYFEFFRQKNHSLIAPSKLVLEQDPTTLFTSAGMQPLVPYLKGQPHPQGKRLVNSQACFRSQDIEEVGDNRHTTLFEMLGNWSLGDYFKKEQLAWIWEFLTQVLGLPKERLFVSIFEGNKSVPRDSESLGIWKDLGVEDSHIYFYDETKNWWSLSGMPEVMQSGEIGGLNSEIFFEFENVTHDPRFGEKCHPNCECGRFLEIGNSVFIQYQKDEKGELVELAAKNVDFGGGLERLIAATNNDPDIFNTDLFKPLISKIAQVSSKTYYESKNQAQMRVVADHLKASVFLIQEELVPSNKLQGYVLRRLLRRASVKMHQLMGDNVGVNEFIPIVEAVFEIYKDTYFKDNSVKAVVREVLILELDKFARTLTKGMSEFRKQDCIDGKVAFDLYQTYGFPLEITQELAIQKGLEINREEFYAEFHKHQDLSRSASGGMFKGGLSEVSEKTTRLHSATHLLHQALRSVLGDKVTQKGSNITEQRLRFDFSYPEKLTSVQISKVEELVNEKIQEGLGVRKEEMSLPEAKQSGAIGLFEQKYGEKVSIYSIGDFSKEFCGGPHVSNTKEIGQFKIQSEESVANGIRRIKATLT